MRGIIGRKVGMTQLFRDDSTIVPVTVVEVMPNVVLQRKVKEKDGYTSVQLGYGKSKKTRTTKAEVNHAKKYGSEEAPQFIKEFRDMVVADDVTLISPSIFNQGDLVDVKGTSKGKGFTGAIKKHGFSRGPMGHGSGYHRGHGSSGALSLNRVVPGKKMAGRMGGEAVTIQNLEIIRVSDSDNYILISGAIPGPKKGYVLIREAIKNINKNTGKTLLDIKETKDKLALLEEAKRVNIKVTTDMTNDDIRGLLMKHKEKEGK